MSIRDNLGGGSAGSVLDTLEEIEANTEAGKAAGALAVKELNDRLGGLYSQEETIIGTFNNSNVYRKTIVISNVTKDVPTKYTHNIGINTVLGMDGFCGNTPLNYVGTTTYAREYVSSIYEVNQNDLGYFVGNSVNGTDIIITLTYTK